MRGSSWVRVGLGALVAIAVTLAVSACGSSSSGSSSSKARSSGASSSGASATEASTAALVSAGAGLKAPEYTKVTIWGAGIPDLSDLAYDSKGRLWATATHDPMSKTIPPPGDGVYLLEKGKPPLKVISTAKMPIGLTWDHEDLYVYNYGYIEMYSGFNGRTFSHHKVLVSHIGAGESGWSDNPTVGPDGRIYVENGAGCDACQPHGYLEADTISFKPDGSDLKIFAKGIRGNSFSEFMPGTSDLFEAMDQQNALVPAPDDQLAIVHEGDNWGFPTCYGQGGAVCNGIATAIAYLPQHNGSAGMALINGQLGTE
jgi:hypothetical protein